MLNVYIYDGTFEGLLSAVFEAWKDKDFSDIRTESENTDMSLIENMVNVTTDTLKSDRITKWIKSKIGFESLKKIYRVYLTERSDRGRIIFRYLKIASAAGSVIDDLLTHPDIMNINSADRLFSRETMRLHGFLRFEVLANDVLYAEISPEYNQLEIISPFFADRFLGNPWIIHDTKRDIAAIFDGEHFILTEAGNNLPRSETKSERNYKEMWKGYLSALTIKERMNLKLQQQFIPYKIRMNMTEFQN